MTEGGGIPEEGAPAPIEPSGWADSSPGTSAAIGEDAVAEFNGFFDGREYSSMGGESARESAVEAFNAASLGEEIGSSPKTDTDHARGNSGQLPDWYSRWQDTGELPSQPHRPAGADLVPDWDPGPAYRRGRTYLDELAKGVPSGGGGGRNQSDETPFQAFDAWLREIEQARQQFDKTVEWNRRAVERARAGGRV